MHIRIWWQIAMFSFLLFVLISIAVNHDVLYAFDHSIISIVQQFENDVLTKIFIIFTNIGSFLGSLTILFCLLYVFFKFKWVNEGIILTFVTLITPLSNLLLKQLMQRPRPHLHRLIEIGGFSFPSGHSMYAASLYGITFVLLWGKCTQMWQRILLTAVTVLMISMIGVSRIYLGVHYPSDVLGGYIISIFIISITVYTYLLIKKYQRKVQ